MTVVAAVFSCVITALGVNWYHLAANEPASSIASEKRIHVFAAFARQKGRHIEPAGNVPTAMNHKAKPANMPWRTITKVVDGDTVHLDDGAKVRLNGIDAPESTTCQKLYADMGRMAIGDVEEELLELGRRATEYARELAEGRRCWLEYEGPTRDGYRRTLAHVHLEDGVVLNERMLADGYAKVYHRDFARKEFYTALMRDAERNGRGLWAPAER